MSLLGRFFDYSKPGKGVDPDEPQKRPFFLYFELLWRKFSRFFFLNLCYSVVILPMAFAVYLIAWGALFDYLSLESVQNANPEIAGGAMPSMIFMFALQFFSLPVPVWVGLLGLSVVLFGPVTCGLTYITRNWVRQEHADLSDLKDRAKSNFKQGLILGILDIGIYLLLLRNVFVPIDTTHLGEFTAIILSVTQTLSVVGLILYSFMRLYTYQMVITFDLKLLHILKNAWLFAIMGIFRNLLATAVMAVTLVLFFVLHPVVELIFFFLFAFSYWAYSNNFITYPIIKKFMIKDEEPIENPEQPE